MKRPMAQSSVRTNAVLWGAWCMWLAAQSLHWSDATAQSVATFLSGPAPSLRRQHRRARHPSKMSSLTKVRYFRVLRGVYENAYALGWIDEVPTTGKLQPPYVPKDAQGAVLPPGVLAQFQNTRQLQNVFVPTTDSKRQWWVLRDRAAVALVAECGITTAELIELKLCDLGAGPDNIVQAMNKAAQRPLFGGESKSGGEDETPTPALNLRYPAIDNPASARMPASPVVLTVRPSHTMQGRDFVLPAWVCEVLLPWVALREDMLTTMACSLAAPARLSDYLKEHSLNGPLFPSRQSPKSADGKAIRDRFFAMESGTVYLIFKRAFAGLEADGVAGAQGKARTAQGASVIRNTLIQHWLRTMPEEEAQVRAGFKTLVSMRVIARAVGITTSSNVSSDQTVQAEIEGAEARVDKSR